MEKLRGEIEKFVNSALISPEIPNLPRSDFPNPNILADGTTTLSDFVNFLLLSNLSSFSSDSKKRLTFEQLSNIRKNAHFTDDQKNEWAVSFLVQVGTEKTKEIFRKRTQSAICGIFCATLEILKQGKYKSINTFGIRADRAITSITRGIFLIVSQVLGIWQYKPRFTDGEIDELLYIELLRNICSHFSVSSSFSEDEYVLRDELEHKVILSRCVPELYIMYRERIMGIVGKWNEENEGEKDGEKRLENLKRIMGNQKEMLDVLNMCQEWSEIQRNSSVSTRRHMEQYCEKLRAENPFMFGIEPWRSAMFEQELSRFLDQKGTEDWQKFVDATAPSDPSDGSNALIKLGLSWYERNYKIRSEELKMEMMPRYHCLWKRRVWNPHRWTVTLQEAMTVGAKSYYTLNQNEDVSTNSSLLFWRWIAVYLRAFVWISNFWSIIALDLMWNSPISVQALFRVNEFHPHWKFDSETGHLEPDREKPVPTLVSRAVGVVVDIRESRARFEAQGDHGLIPRNFSRMFNIAWNYLVRGLLGLSLLFVLQPLLSVFAWVCGLVLLLASIPLAPALAVMSHLLFDTLVFDSLGSRRWFPLPRYLISSIMFWGVFRLGLALFAAFAVFFGSLALLPLSAAAAVFRFAYDFVIFHLVIKPKGRLPTQDTMIARRIRGPALNQSTVVQITADAALLTVRARLESNELIHFEPWAKECIDADYEIWTSALTSLMQPFGQLNITEYTATRSAMSSLIKANPAAKADLDRIARRYEAILMKKEAAIKTLGEAMVERAKHLERWGTTPYANDGSRIIFGMALADLEAALPPIMDVIRSFYMERLFPIIRARALLREAVTLAKEGIRTPITAEREQIVIANAENKFWKDLDLRVHDWSGYTQVVVDEALGADFLTPLEEMDITLRVDHPSFTTLVHRMVAPRGTVSLTGDGLEKKSLSIIRPSGAPTVAPVRTRSKTNLMITLGGGPVSGGYSFSPSSLRPPDSENQVLLPVPEPPKISPSNVLVEMVSTRGELETAFTTLLYPPLIEQYFPAISTSTVHREVRPIRPFDERLGAFDSRLRQYRRSFPRELEPLNPHLPPRNFLHLLPLTTETGSVAESPSVSRSMSPHSEMLASDEDALHPRTLSI